MSLHVVAVVGRLFGIDGGGRPVRFRLLHIFELRDGLIIRENAWLDLAAIQRQLGGDTSHAVKGNCRGEESNEVGKRRATRSAARRLPAR